MSVDTASGTDSPKRARSHRRVKSGKGGGDLVNSRPSSNGWNRSSSRYFSIPFIALFGLLSFILNSNSIFGFLLSRHKTWNSADLDDADEEADDVATSTVPQRTRRASIGVNRLEALVKMAAASEGKADFPSKFATSPHLHSLKSSSSSSLTGQSAPSLLEGESNSEKGENIAQAVPTEADSESSEKISVTEETPFADEPISSTPTVKVSEAPPSRPTTPLPAEEEEDDTEESLDSKTGKDDKIDVKRVAEFTEEQLEEDHLSRVSNYSWLIPHIGMKAGKTDVTTTTQLAHREYVLILSLL